MESLIQVVRPVYQSHSDPSHDWAHIQRVTQLALDIGRLEGADLEIVEMAALLHDIINLPKNHPERKNASRLAADEAQRILKEIKIEDSKIEWVRQVIEEHSYSRGSKPSTIEAAVVQDCDRLDTLGAIGIFRTASIGTQLGASFFNPEEFFARHRPLDDKKYTVDHFFTKLFKLPGLMNTASGRREAEKRVDFMKEFIAQLASEVGVAIEPVQSPEPLAPPI